MRALVISSLMLVACNAPPAGETSVESGPAAAATETTENGCPVGAAAVWRGDGGELQIGAGTFGATCATSRVTITIRNQWHTGVFNARYQVSDIETLAGAEDAADMERRLHEWISQPGAAADSTGDLPIWADGADQPSEGDQTFTPVESLDQVAYEARRARDEAMFCFVQGAESMMCVTTENGELVQLGVLSVAG